MATSSNSIAGSIDDFIEMVGLPKDALFLGYTVHLPNTDEFLSSFGKSPSALIVWTQIPEYALVTKDYKRVVEIFNDAATTNSAAAIVLM
jgi:hypothetical protein